MVRLSGLVRASRSTRWSTSREIELGAGVELAAPDRWCDDVAPAHAHDRPGEFGEATAHVLDDAVVVVDVVVTTAAKPKATCGTQSRQPAAQQESGACASSTQRRSPAAALGQRGREGAAKRQTCRDRTVRRHAVRSTDSQTSLPSSRSTGDTSHAWGPERKMSRLSSSNPPRAGKELYERGHRASRVWRSTSEPQAVPELGAVYGFWPAHPRRRRRRCRRRDALAWGASRRITETTGPTSPLRTTSRRRVTHSVPVAVAVHGAESPRITSTSSTTIAASSSRRSPIGLAEAFAERLHEQARASGTRRTKNCRRTSCTTADSACLRLSRVPRSQRKAEVCSRCSGRGKAGLLTESFAVSAGRRRRGGPVHPAAKYFTVGRIGRDHLEDYAGRKGVAVAEAER